MFPFTCDNSQPYTVPMFPLAYALGRTTIPLDQLCPLADWWLLGVGETVCNPPSEVVYFDDGL